MKHVSVRADTQKISKLAVQRFRSRSIILKRKMFYFLESYMKTHSALGQYGSVILILP